MRPVRVVHLILLGAVVCVVLAMIAGIPEQIGRAYAWVSRAEAAQDLPIPADPAAKGMSERGPPRSEPGVKFAVEANPWNPTSGPKIPPPPPVADPYPPKEKMASHVFAKPVRPILEEIPAKGPGAKPEELIELLPKVKEPVAISKKTEPDPRLQARQAQSEQQRILGRYARSTGESERSGLKAALVMVLDQQFDLQQQERWAEIAAIEARVRRLREMLEKRNRARQTIVEERLAQLLREAEGLGWIAPGEPGPARGVSSPFEENVREQEIVMPDGSRVRQLIPEYRLAFPPVPAPTASPFDDGKPTPGAAPPPPSLQKPPPPPLPREKGMPREEKASLPPALPPEKGMPREEKALPPPSPTR